MVADSAQAQRSPFASQDQQEVFASMCELINEGIGGVYRDLCILRHWPSSAQPLESVTNLAFHLAREIESTVREVVTTQDNREKYGGVTGAHKLSIQDTLQRLAIATEHEASVAWLKFAGRLQTFAHRNGLRIQGPISKDGLDILSDFDEVLLHVLRAYRVQFVEYFRKISVLTTVEQPTNNDVSLLERLPAIQLQMHFYRNVMSPAWLTLLHRNGILKPYGTFHRDSANPNALYNLWPPSLYLERMAPLKPNEVASVYVEVLPDAGDSILHSAVKAAVLMPPEIAAKILIQIARRETPR